MLVDTNVLEESATSIFKVEDGGSTFLKIINNNLKKLVYSGAVKLHQNFRFVGRNTIYCMVDPI
jgi:hypothetical protein